MHPFLVRTKRILLTLSLASLAPLPARAQDEPPTTSIEVKLEPGRKADYEKLLARLQTNDPLDDAEAAEWESRFLAVVADVEPQSAELAGDLWYLWGGTSVTPARMQTCADALERAEVFYVQAESETKLAELHLAYSRLLSYMVRPDEAWERAERALEYYERHADDRGQIAALLRRSDLHERRHRYEEADDDAEHAVEIAEKVDDPALVAKAVLRRATVMMRWSKLDGVEHARRAADIYRELEDDEKLADALYVEGCTYGTQNRTDEAFRVFDECERVVARLPGNSLFAALPQERGLSLVDQNRFQEALTEFELAYQRYVALPEPDEVFDFPLAENTRNRAFLLAIMGRLEGSLELYGEAIERARRSDFPTCISMSLRDRGFVHRALGQPAEGLRDFEAGLPVAEEYDLHLEVGFLTWGRGVVLSDLGRFDEAAEALRRCEKLRDEQLTRDPASRFMQSVPNAAIAWARGVLLQKQGRHEEALVELAKSEGIAKVVAEFLAHPYMAHVPMTQLRSALALDRAEDALGYASRAAALIEQYLTDQAARLGSYTSQSVRVYMMDVLTGALAALARIEAPSDESREQAYAVLQTFQGFGVAAVLAERGQISSPNLPEDLRREMFELNERILSLTGRRTALINSYAPTLMQKIQIGTEVARITGAVPKLEQKHEELITRARSLDRSYMSVSYPRPATIAAVQDVLQRDEALVEYVFDEAGVHAFVVCTASVDVVRLGGAETISKSIGRLESALETESTSDAVTLGPLRNLGRLLLDPVLAKLTADHETLIVAPSGPISRVPFEALLIAAPESEKPSSWPYLIRERAVCYVHSGTVLREQRQRRPERRDDAAPFLFALADPRLEPGAEVPRVEDDVGRTFRGTYGELPNAAAEVFAIAGRFSASDPDRVRLAEVARRWEEGDYSTRSEALSAPGYKVLLGAAATEAALKRDPSLRTATVVHFALHGEGDTEVPSFSRLLLAPGVGEDGFLYLRELRDLGLSCRLLVLSACETNAGSLTPFDGVSGFARAGLAAGAQAVLGTLRKVDDATARELVDRFYEEWLQRGHNRVDALAIAKRRAIDDARRLSTWSAYVLWDLPP